MIISMAEEMNPVCRSTMEDGHVYYTPEELNCGDPNVSMLGVYDGHGGRDIADFLETHLSQNIAQEWKHPDNASISERLERAFLFTDVQSRLMGLLTSGATVVVVLLKTHSNGKGWTLYTANCGDARAVLYSASSCSGTTSPVIRLSQDHRASNPEEIRRIESAGGFVARNRVLGIMAVSRSLGDHEFKEYIIGRPYVNEINIDKQNDGEDEPFVILACDGLWDVMTDETAVELVKKTVFESRDKGRNEKSKKEVAQLLINEALERGCTDNITVVVAWL